MYLMLVWTKTMKCEAPTLYHRQVAAFEEHLMQIISAMHAAAPIGPWFIISAK